MKIVLNKSRQAGDLVSLDNDFIQQQGIAEGLDLKQVEQHVMNYNLLARDKKMGDELVSSDFRKARIACVIACRVNSSRLPNKALLKIGNYASVELCIKNSLKFKNVDYTILATTQAIEDAILEDYTYSPDVKFFRGDTEDVMKRFLDAIEPYDIDIIVRKTADCPFPSTEIFEMLLKRHFLFGADYTTANKNTIGTGSEIMNVKSLKEIKAYFPHAYYSEYMTWYFKNNPEFFKLNIVDLPVELIRNYRLTLDYQEDLDMFNHIQKYLDENNMESSIENIFKFLDVHPEISSMNSHLTLKYKTDQKLISTLNRETKMI